MVVIVITVLTRITFWGENYISRISNDVDKETVLPFNLRRVVKIFGRYSTLIQQNIVGGTPNSIHLSNSNIVKYLPNFFFLSFIGCKEDVLATAAADDNDDDDG